MGIFTLKKPNGDLHSPSGGKINERTKRRSRPRRVGLTTDQRRDSRRRAGRLPQGNERARRAPAQTAGRPRCASRDADDYKPTIKTHKAKPATSVPRLLVAFFGTVVETSGGQGQPNDDLLTHIDRERVVRLHNWRRPEPRPPQRDDQPRYRSAEVMLRDACRSTRASPLVGMKRFKSPTARRRLMTPNEETRLLNTAKRLDKVFYALFVLAFDTLTRMGDLLDLRRTHRTGDVLWIADPKNDDGYDTVLSPRAEAALQAIETKDTDYYFAKFRRAENPRDWVGAVRQRFEYLCKKAGLRYGRAHGGLTFHWATRRTGATRYLLEKGAPISAVQKQGNWKHPEMLLRIYAEARRDDQLAMVGAPRLRKRA
jgi:integrase